MSCNKNEDQLIGYLTGILEHEERDRLEAHLSSCQSCQRRLEELKDIRDLFKRWKPVTPPLDLKSKVMDSLKALTLIEEKANKQLKDISMDDVVEWLRKRVKSEQIRIYKVLTDFLGREKGEEVFEYYLEEDLKKKMSAPPKEVLFNLQAFGKSLGLEVEVKRMEGGVMKETIRNCSYISIAKELGMKASPCEAICVKQTKLREKFHPVKVELIKKMPNKDGECIFLHTTLEPKPSQ